MTMTIARRYLTRGTPADTGRRRNPYPGARPFSEDESEWFHGRRAEVDALAALVRAQRFCLLYAPSGAGKSSLISAGLLPRLKHDRRGPSNGPRAGGDFDVVGIAKVHPSAARKVEGWPSADEVPNVYVRAALNSLDPESPLDFATLAEFFAARPQHTDEFGDPLPRLLVLDQFEEILEPFDRDDWLLCRDGFFDQLDEVLVNDTTVHVLVAIREDHLATIERLTAHMDVPFQARYRLDKLTTAAAEHAIELPAAAAGMPVEPDVTKRLVRELAQRRIEELGRLVPDEFIEPGQLQVVCNRLWAKADEDKENHRTDRPPAIRMSHVRAAGGVEGSLRKYYEDAVTEVARGRELRALRKFMERQLVSPRFTRQLVAFNPEAPKTGKVRNETLRRLEDPYGLVRRERRGGTVYWELSHDGFIDPIRRANLETWDRRRVRRNKWMAGAVAVALLALIVGRVIASPGDNEPTSDVPPTIPTLQQVPIRVSDPLPTAVGAGDFSAGEHVVIELVQPADGTARATLRRARDGTVEAADAPADAPHLVEYTIPANGVYEVRVDAPTGAPPTALGVNIRRDASIVELPDVVGSPAEAASTALTKAGLVVNSIRSVCSGLSDLSVGETLGVVDLDREVTPDVSGVLVTRTPTGLVPSEPVPAATGTALAINAWDGTRCSSVPSTSIAR
jgi:hypothetical protein